MINSLDMINKTHKNASALFWTKWTKDFTNKIARNHSLSNSAQKARVMTLQAKKLGQDTVTEMNPLFAISFMDNTDKNWFVKLVTNK